MAGKLGTSEAIVHSDCFFSGFLIRAQPMLIGAFARQKENPRQGKLGGSSDRSVALLNQETIIN